MEILNIDDFTENRYQTAIALGNFDGIHYGHQVLIKNMVKKAKMNGLKGSVLLFQNHTKECINGTCPSLMSTIQQKYDLLNKLGVDMVYNIEFNETIMKLSPEEFVIDMLINKLNVKSIFIGYDYRFGYKAKGNSNLLRAICNSYGIYVEVLEPITFKDEVVSSTRIRSLIEEAKLEDVKALLGRNYSIIGKVVSGKSLGSKLGFPTANIEPIINYVIPKHGVYSTEIIVNNKKYLSATSVGYNPTFNEKTIKIETHIIDFANDIYDENVKLIFVDYLREEIEFSDLDSLVNQIKKDIEMVKTRHNYLQNM